MMLSIIKKIGLICIAVVLLLYCSLNINRHRGIQTTACPCYKTPACIEAERAAADQISYYQNPLDSEVKRERYEVLKKRCCGNANRCCNFNYDAQVLQNESHSEVS